MPRTSAQARVSLSTTDPDLIAAGVFEFCAAAYPGLPISSGMRELVLRGMGTDPMDAAVTVARRAALSATIYAMRVVVAEAFNTAADTFRAEAMIARANYEASVSEAVAMELRKRGIEP